MLMEPRLLQNYNKDKEKANGDVERNRNEDCRVQYCLFISINKVKNLNLNGHDASAVSIMREIVGKNK